MPSPSLQPPAPSSLHPSPSLGPYDSPLPAPVHLGWQEAQAPHPPPSLGR